jgi:hypothetical protein
MTLLRRLAAIVAIGGCLLASSAGPAVAASPTASPPRALRSRVGPSQVILGPTERTGTFTAYNAGDVELTVTTSTYDFVVDSAGNRTPATGPVPLGAAAWLSVDPSAFTLALKGSQAVTFDVNVPKDAAPGDHYAGIQMLGSASDAAWGQLQAQLGDRSVVRSQVAFPVTVIIRVPGEVQNDLQVDQASLSMAAFTTVMGGDYIFRPRIVNDGNVAATWIPAADSTAAPDTIVPTLRLTSTMGFLAGDQLLYAMGKDRTPAPVTVLPGTTRTQELVLKDVPIVGSYEYTYTLPGSEADGRATVTATGSVTIVNLQKVGLYVVLPLILILVLIVGWLISRRRRRSQARKAAEDKERDREQMRAEALEQVRQEEAAKREAALLGAVTADEERQAALDREGEGQP